MLRYEYKYYVSNQKLDLLRALVEPNVKLDKFAASCPEKHYTVRSIYFETPDFECYHTKMAGIKNRIKVRLRGYNEEDISKIVFMEIKRKFESPIFKDRAPLTYGGALEVIGGKPLDNYIMDKHNFEVSRDSARKFLYNVHGRNMKPVVNVIYEREPWLNRFDDSENNLRITFDKNLRSNSYPTLEELYMEKESKYTLEGFFILEIKFNIRFPVWMNPIIKILNLKRQSASKYCLCVDSHYPKINIDNRFDTLSRGRIFSD
ncbi:MAG: SPX domain protein involved in polyphosphate accumulation [Saprospiraceae bacterium]|jgi:SPX domain protein involved in polyphosphate accumulation